MSPSLRYEMQSIGLDASGWELVGSPNNDGFVSKEDIRIMLSYVPFQ